MIVKMLFKFLFLFLFSFSSIVCFSQDILRGTDLSTAKVDRLTDADIIKYQDQLKTYGLTQQQAEQIALAKGFPPAELIKLRQRIAALNTNKLSIDNNSDNNNQIRENTKREEPYDESFIEQRKINTKIFGSEIFSTASSTFQTNLKIATPLNYQLGPDDQLQISVYGLQEASFNLTISPDGTIYIPNVGEIKVSGYTIEEATEKIRSRMSSIYSSLRSGRSKLSINLGKIRSIRVTVLGSYKPGTYTVSSLSTVFNALYLSGGPALNGSYREIELLRDNKVVKKIDLYNYLTSGSKADDIRLQENDIIRIPVYKTRVEIAGEVKRPGIFEMLPGETVEDLLRFASGFTDSAYKASIKVIQITDKEKKVQDITAAQFTQYHPSTGDYLEVSKVLNRFQNRITISGAVFRPGYFELTNNMTVGQLIRKADGLREDAYTKRGQIFRLKEDLTKEVIPFDITDVLTSAKDILLKREDSVYITSIFDLKDQYSVAIQGEVRKPGTFRYIDSLTVKDLILQAGGFTDAAYPQRIEIARVIKRDTLTAQDVRLSEIINIRDLNDLSYSNKNIILKPFDVITVRKLPGYLELKSVYITGQAQYPGPYVLANRAERVSDLIKRAGGLAPEAYASGAYLKRVNDKNTTTEFDTAKVQKIQKALKDTTGEVTFSVNRKYDQIPLDLTAIFNHPGSDADLILKAEDEIVIPRNDQGVKISGEVLSPTQAAYNKNNSLKEYISEAGGYTENARKNKVYVLYPNGKAAITKHFLVFRSYPKITPGTEIIVPKALPRVKRSTAETVGIASAIASLAGVVIAIIQLTKK